MMRFAEWILCGMLLLAIVLPVAAASEARYAYVNVEKVTIELVNDQATLQIDYSLDMHAKILIWLLGTNDLRGKLYKITNYESAIPVTIEYDRAVFLLEGEVIDYGDGAFWFQAHQFGMRIPSLAIHTPKNVILYSQVSEIQNGVGYFRVPE